MGYTGLARWINAPTTGIELIHQNILRNLQGQYKSKWSLSIRSFRSTLSSIPGYQVPAERSMIALTMNDNVFVLLDDPAAPMRLEYQQMLAGYTQAQTQTQTQPDTAAPPAPGPAHYRHTFPTLSPPGALEQLLAQLRARWVSVRQTASSGGAGTKGQGAGAGAGTTGAGGLQVVVEGHVYAIGTDWLVRAGNVQLAGGAVKGMFLEAEYLPLPTMPTRANEVGGTDLQHLLSNLLLSVLPNVPDARIVAVTIGDAQWDEILWDEPEGGELAHDVPNPQKGDGDDDDDGDIYAAEGDLPATRKGDWVGVERDRRSAFLIIGALKQEGLI